MSTPTALEPLWVKLARGDKLAGLDVHSASYLVSGQRWYGAGDLSQLQTLLDPVARAGLQLLQLNPISDSGPCEPCPYKSLSQFSFNPIYLDLNQAPFNDRVFDSLKAFAQTRAQLQSSDIINYQVVYEFKLRMLKAAFSRFSGSSRFSKYCKKASRDVKAYVLFKFLKEQFQTPWQDWPKEYKTGNFQAIIKAHPQIRPRLAFYLFTQWVLDEQWHELQVAAAQKGLYLMFDKAIYPELDSAEVWANQHLFYLHPNGQPEYVSGCNNPKDPFGSQIWGHAVYRFDQKPQEIIDYFIKSARFLSQFSQVIRLDHALALVWKYYLVDPKTKKGKHYPALGYRLLRSLRTRLPDTFFIAEDAGYVNPAEVEQPLRENGLPGIRCLQWYQRQYYQETSSFPPDCLACLSNHDTPALLTWWEMLSPKGQQVFKKQVKLLNRDYRYCQNSAKAMLALTELICRSPAQIVMCTLRDIVFDSWRYNEPGTQKAQNWQLKSPVLVENIDFTPIKRIVQKTGRGQKQNADKLLVCNPQLTERIFSRAGEILSFSVASRQKPSQITLLTNLPLKAGEDAWIWRKKNLIITNKQLQKYAQNTYISKVELQIVKQTPPGDYELAAVLKIKGQEVNVMKFGENLKIVVEP